MIWLWLSAAFMVTTAGVHSVLGYRRMIVPLLRGEAGPLADALTRRIIRFAWHATSVLMLISAAAVAGRTITCWPSIAIDVKNAGGLYVDKPVVIDGNIITSRKPDDIPAFSDAIVAAVRR